MIKRNIENQIEIVNDKMNKNIINENRKININDIVRLLRTIIIIIENDSIITIENDSIIIIEK